jgi:phytoene synthase
MAFEIQRTREYYASADLGIPMLPRSSARCIRSARCLYSEILDRIEQANGDVFRRRARVPTARKLWVVARNALS